MNTRLTFVLSKLHILATSFLFLMLAMPDKLLPMSIVIWAVTWLFWRVFAKKEDILILTKKQKYAVALLGIWTIISFISTLFTEIPNTGLIERRLMLILLPLILLVGENKYINRAVLSKSMFLGGVISILIYLVLLLIKYKTIDIDPILLRAYISTYKHPAYYSLILIIGLYSLTSILDFKRKSNLILFILVYLISGLLIYLIRSRVGIINYSILSFIILFQQGKKYLNPKFIFIITSIIFIGIFAAIATNEKFIDITYRINNENVQKFNREILWKSSLQMIKEKPILGYGLGGGKDGLIQRTFDNGVKDAFTLSQNSHNQYLQTTIDNGLLGLCLLILFIVLFISSSTAKSEKVLVIFIAISFLFESMLERISGIAIFCSLMYWFIIPNNYVELKKSRLTIMLNIIPLILLLYIIIHSAKSRYLTLDSNMPATYGFGNYHIIDNLPDILPEEIQKNTLGYKLDNTATVNPYINSLFLTEISKFAPNAFDSISSSVYCYLSEDFDGEDAFIGMSGSKYGIKVYYDKNKKGTWQKLLLKKEGTNVKSSLNLYFTVPKDKDIKDMNGYVIFAKPEYKIYKYGSIIKESK